jgi:hypothetical protein
VNARAALILSGLSFAVWESIDVFWIDFPAAAALFAGLFLGCTLWFWRRNSVRAAMALLVLFAFEAAAVPSFKGVMTVTKVVDVTLSFVGIALAVAVFVTQKRTRPISYEGT